MPRVLKVYVVDDDPVFIEDLCRTVSRRFRRAGRDIEWGIAESYSQAEEIFFPDGGGARERCDAVLVDLRLPYVRRSTPGTLKIFYGVRLWRRLQEEYEKVPVFAITGVLHLVRSGLSPQEEEAVLVKQGLMEYQEVPLVEETEEMALHLLLLVLRLLTQEEAEEGYKALETYLAKVVQEAVETEDVQIL